MGHRYSALLRGVPRPALADDTRDRRIDVARRRRERGAQLTPCCHAPLQVGARPGSTGARKHGAGGRGHAGGGGGDPAQSPHQIDRVVHVAQPGAQERGRCAKVCPRDHDLVAAPRRHLGRHRDAGDSRGAIRGRLSGGNQRGVAAHLDDPPQLARLDLLPETLGLTLDLCVADPHGRRDDAVLCRKVCVRNRARCVHLPCAVRDDDGRHGCSDALGLFPVLLGGGGAKVGAGDDHSVPPPRGVARHGRGRSRGFVHHARHGDVVDVRDRHFQRRLRLLRRLGPYRIATVLRLDHQLVLNKVFKIERPRRLQFEHRLLAPRRLDGHHVPRDLPRLTRVRDYAEHQVALHLVRVGHRDGGAQRGPNGHRLRDRDARRTDRRRFVHVEDVDEEEGHRGRRDAGRVRVGEIHLHRHAACAMVKDAHPVLRQKRLVVKARRFQVHIAARERGARGGRFGAL